MNGLLKEKELWKGFVPVAFHVDYWDYIGWKDQFASPLFTKRQNVYGNKWGQTSVYTPCFVLNGDEWPEWLTARDLPKNKKSTEVGILKVESGDAGNFLVRFSSKNVSEVGYEAHAALLGFGVDSNINAGENSGRTFAYNFIVLAYRLMPMQKLEGNNFETKIELNGVTDQKKQGLAVWISEPGDPTPIQSAGGFLNSPAKKETGHGN